jgi:ABC-type nitrate/sulfonate/bicarbonate transport system substrate-binding protein
MTHPLSRREFSKSALAAVGASALASSYVSDLAAFAAPSPAPAANFNFQSIWINDPEFIGYMIAIDNGYYAAEGLTINYMPGGPDVIPEAALISGKADISLTNLTATVRAVSTKGAPLKIIGAQYQKSPIGLISLAQENIKGPADLVGKRVACPPLSISIFEAILKLHGVPKEKVRMVPFTFDPAPLIRGDVDGMVDFTNEIPFLVEQRSGKKTSYFLFWDVGLPLFIDLVTVTSDTLKSRRPQLVKFLRASRKGWNENNADPAKYPAKFASTWFKGNGSTPAAELSHNKEQIPLMTNPKGLFAIDDAAIDANLAALSRIGLKGSRDMFDTSLLAEI